MNKDQLDKKLKQWIEQATAAGMSKEAISDKVSELYINFCDQEIPVGKKRTKKKKEESTYYEIKLIEKGTS